MSDAKLLRYRLFLVVLSVIWLLLSGVYGSALFFAGIESISLKAVPFKAWFMISAWHWPPELAYIVGVIRFAIVVAVFVYFIGAVREYGHHFVLRGSELRKFDSRGRQIGQVDLTQAEIPQDLYDELQGRGWRFALGSVFYTGAHRITDRNGGVVAIATRYLQDTRGLHEGLRRALGVEEA